MDLEVRAALAKVAGETDPVSAADTVVALACEMSGFQEGLLTLAIRAGVLVGSHGLTPEVLDHFLSRAPTVSLAERETNRARLAELAYPGTRIAYVRAATGRFNVVPSTRHAEEQPAWSSSDALYLLIPGCEGQIVGVLSLDAPGPSTLPTPAHLARVELLLEAVGPLLEARLLRQRLGTLERGEAETHKLQMLGALAVEVVHDLNNLLTIVLVSSSSLLEDTHEPLQRELVEANIEAAERAGELCSRLMNVGRSPLRPDAVIDLGLTVAEQRPLMERVLGDIVLELSLQEIPLPVQIPPGRLVQVLLNLAVNAREAAPVSHVWITTTRLDEHGTSFAVLQVRDDGCGMSEDVVQRIYEPFFTTRATGSGVGLATVKRIVDRLRGRIHIHSATGMGTTFSVELPLAETRG